MFVIIPPVSHLSLLLVLASMPVIPPFADRPTYQSRQATHLRSQLDKPMTPSAVIRAISNESSGNDFPYMASVSDVVLEPEYRRAHAAICLLRNKNNC